MTARLHLGYDLDEEGYYRSLPPHVPGSCYGALGDPCPAVPYEPCEHKHRSHRAVLACSAKRRPFNRQET